MGQDDKYGEANLVATMPGWCYQVSRFVCSFGDVLHHKKNEPGLPRLPFESTGIEGKNHVQEEKKSMFDEKILKCAVLAENLLEQLTQCRNIPLTFAYLVQELRYCFGVSI